MRCISGDKLVACVQRSAAPLQDLALGGGFGFMGSTELHDCFSLIPTLTRFRMWCPGSGPMAGFFTVLADNPSLLPNLHDLTISNHNDLRIETHISESSWRTLVRALSARRIEQLYIGTVRLSPPTDVLDSFRELVAHGAAIYVGYGRQNYVVA
ncbi:hypothetical protein C8R45DRAFT_1216574 [Mycena sanguinolenta]|nr:hypothetical protein C8R45DRAFT_1216574 [Mycena sanguinolenta]